MGRRRVGWPGRVGGGCSLLAVALLAGCGGGSTPAGTPSGPAGPAGPAGSVGTAPSPSGTASATVPGARTAPGIPGATGPAVAGGVPGAVPGTPTGPVVATTPATPRPATGATPAPAWIGRTVLAKREDGSTVVPPTPPEFDPRNIETVDVLPPPADGRFRSTVAPVPPDVLARATWAPGCPVALTDLRYVTVSFVGFDGRAHTGELIVHRTAATAMTRIFRKLYAARFPIERMVVTTVAERDAPPTGDGNTTAAFTCRSAAGSSRWSEHAKGLAVDVNPFMNPYEKGDVLLPELASTYKRRGDVRPGMVVRGDVVVRAFAAEGWSWGGNWKSLKDYMHFSRNGT